MNVKRNRNKFRLTRFILLKLSRLFQFLSRFRTARKRLLLVKIDAIGDYVLFRNYLQVLKESDRYKDYEIDLVGNERWEELARTYDSQYVNEFFFINEEDLYYKPSAVFKLGYGLFKRKYEVVLQPTYSRTLLGNGLAALASGKEIIAFDGNDELYPRYKKKTDKLYTKLLSLPAGIVHEFERNQNFFEQITGEKGAVKGPSLPVKKDKEEGIVIFPGSREVKRNWEKEKFLELIKRLLQSTNETIVLAGGPSEIELAHYLITNLPSERIVNKTGELSLPAFVELIANAKLLISNETSSVHIGSACSTPTICILGGGHFKRFTPYPDTLLSSITCVYEEMSCFNCNWVCKYLTDERGPFPCISSIKTNQVFVYIESLLSHQNLPTK